MCVTIHPILYQSFSERNFKRKSMKESTQEQDKRFWEWCGLTWGVGGGWFDSEGKYLGDELPIDLNNLIIKYAVPKLNGRYKLEGTGGYHFATVWKDPIAYVEVRDTDPAHALFRAIYKAAGLEE